jgi:hypothetical protein
LFACFINFDCFEGAGKCPPQEKNIMPTVSNLNILTAAERYAYPSQFSDYDTQYGGAKERIGWTWYHLLPYAAATVQLTYFQVIPANLGLGNMKLAGQLGAPQAFFMRALRVKVYLYPTAITAVATATEQTGNLDDLCHLLYQGTLQLSILDKVYGQWPLWMLPAGGGPAAVGVGSIAAAPIYMAENGIQDPRAVYSLSVPLFLAPQVTFKVDIFWNAAVAVVSLPANPLIGVFLDGDLIRPVQ